MELFVTNTLAGLAIGLNAGLGFSQIEATKEGGVYLGLAIGFFTFFVVFYLNKIAEK